MEDERGRLKQTDTFFSTIHTLNNIYIIDYNSVSKTETKQKKSVLHNSDFKQLYIIDYNSVLSKTETKQTKIHLFLTISTIKQLFIL
jgi:hypothetical protein